MYKIPRLAGLEGDPSPSPLPAGGSPQRVASPATPAWHDEQVGDFYSLSVELTGFDEVELRGTGVGDLYLDWLTLAFEDELPELLAAWREVERGCPPAERQDALRESILDHPVLGPLARSVLLLWYTATWSPPQWWWISSEHPGNVNFAFGEAYPEGLMWRAAIGAHPTAAKPTGFGTWAFAPEGA
jgi:hypothetical protein